MRSGIMNINREKRIVKVLLAALMACGLYGCKKAFVVGRDIKPEEVTEFYYTYSNINFDARYQRYHFYAEDNRYMFFHETREKKNNYGPLTEKDTTAAGTRELTAEEWEELMSYLNGGTVIRRQEDASSGDSGPWLYLYWKKDKGEIQEYSFEKPGTVLAFEEFCRSLAQSDN